MDIDGYVSSHLATIKPNEALEDKFVWYCLIMIDAKDLMQDVAYPSLNLSDIKQIKIPLPPLPEQKRIVAILDQAFTAIASAKANAEQNLKNAKALFENYLQGVLSDKKWSVVKLDDVCEKVEYGSSSKSLAEGKLPVLRMGNIQNGILVWDDLKFSNNWQTVSHVNPILYMINAFRYGFLGISDINLGISFVIIIGFIALLFVINLKLLNIGFGIRQ